MSSVTAAPEASPPMETDGRPTATAAEGDGRSPERPHEAPPSIEQSNPAQAAERPTIAEPTVAQDESNVPARARVAGVLADNRRETDCGAFLGMTAGDRFAAAALAAILLCLVAAHWARLSGWGAREVEIERLPRQGISFQLDVNTANWVELAQLDGIGETLARRIVAHRDQHGPFGSLDDLRRVKGIGAKTIEKVRPWLTAEAANPRP